MDAGLLDMNNPNIGGIGWDINGPKFGGIGD